MSGFNEYDQYDAVGLSELVRNGDISPAELVDEAISRVEALNPTINAVVFKMYDHAKLAIRNGLPEGSLLGVPWLLKDLGTYYSGTPTTSGCRLFKDDVANHDSELVQRYKNAGLVIFGKTATPEFGLTTSTESALWGETRNPWSPAHTAGGSSGGTAAAIAAGIVPASDGSDGGGSIRIPASCCGLVGHKVSRGRISPAPDKGEGWSGMSTGGMLSRTVRDTAAALDATMGSAPGDPYCPPPLEMSLTKAIASPPRKLRVAFHTKAYNGAETDAECREAVHQTAKLLEELGHRIEERALEYDTKKFARNIRVIVAGHNKRTVDDQLEKLGRKLHEDDLEPLTLATYNSADRYSAADYVSAINTIHDASRVTARFLENYDVILTPTMPSPPQRLGGALRLNHSDSKEFSAAIAQTVGYTQFYNATGNPAISLPLHWSEAGLPVGVQFAARYGDDPLLLSLAAQLEQARPWAQRRPNLKATATA